MTKTSPLAQGAVSTATITDGGNNSTAGSRLASLASSWGVTFGRRRRAEEVPPGLDSIPQAPSGSDDADEPTARELLKKF